MDACSKPTCRRSCMLKADMPTAAEITACQPACLPACMRVHPSLPSIWLATKLELAAQLSPVHEP
eukprot:360819-Chlamydomonas_euryale.AAC.4